MEQKTEFSSLLNMMLQPGFRVEEGIITQSNSAAQGLLLTVGTDIRPLLLSGQEDYQQLTEGCLYLQLKLGAQGRGAAVLAMEDCQIFLLDPETDAGQLSAYALAARTLRTPMVGVLVAADSLCQSAAASGDRKDQEQAGQLSRGLHQIMRIINNMSDALLFTDVCQQELQNLTSVFDEILEKAQTMLAQAGVRLTYVGPREDILAMADRAQLERAVLNLLSNAARFARGPVEASLTRRGEMLRLSVTDHGDGIPQDILHQIFHRYLRPPGLEDSRYGLGLGMALIRTAAVNHGGTVLIDQPQGATRITMTMALRKSPDARLHSPSVRMDYSGGWDQTMLELSQILPASMYEKNKES